MFVGRRQSGGDDPSRRRVLRTSFGIVGTSSLLAADRRSSGILYRRSSRILAGRPPGLLAGRTASVFESSGIGGRSSGTAGRTGPPARRTFHQAARFVCAATSRPRLKLLLLLLLSYIIKIIGLIITVTPTNLP